MKTILITGATDGIGKQTALELAEKGHQLILHGRSERRGLETLEYITSRTGNKNLSYFNADLADFDEISRFSDQIQSNFDLIDVLINNAGVIEPNKTILPNGLEKTFMVNHLAPFALSLRLLGLIEKSEEGRIVNVSSQAQAGTMDFDNLNGEKYYDSYNAYALSKLENILFTYKLARLLSGKNTTVNALHPGVIRTKLLHAGWGGGGASISTGAKTTVFVSISEELKGVSGKYFVDAQERKSSAISYDQKIQNRLWDISLEICKKNGMVLPWH